MIFFIYIPGFHTSSNIKFINIFMLLDGYGLAPNQFYLYIYKKKTAWHLDWFKLLIIDLAYLCSP
jgi:hypothetical protein